MKKYFCDYCDEGFTEKEECKEHEDQHSQDEEKMLHSKVPFGSVYHLIKN